MSQEGRFTPEYWTKQYLLGIVSEVDEVLREINWKRHRQTHGEPIQRNVALELADLTKYVMSLWQVWGFELNDFLAYVDQKNQEMELRWQMEMMEEPSSANVLITDLDGTGADWRGSFIDWMEEVHDVSPIAEDRSNSLNLDSDLAILYPDYYRLKEEFEETGGYADLLAYVDWTDTVGLLQSQNVFVIAYTARPANKYTHIWWDTWTWLENHGILPNKLYMGAEDRILHAVRLMRKGNQVILFEDNPGLALRAAQAGIQTFVRYKPYNQHIEHKNIAHVSSYRTIIHPIDYYFHYAQKGEEHNARVATGD